MSSAPGFWIELDMPSIVGRLPTRTKPRLSTPKAVVRPRSPGVDEPWKKSVCLPVGERSTMVVPLPCKFPPATLLLKFETRMSPGWSGPPSGNPLGTKATPYGLRSPLAGTVEADRNFDGRLGMIGIPSSRQRFSSDSTARQERGRRRCAAILRVQLARDRQVAHSEDAMTGPPMEETGRVLATPHP